MVNISSIFAKSPFKALHNHMDKVVESVAPLENFFDFLFFLTFLLCLPFLLFLPFLPILLYLVLIPIVLDTVFNE